MRTILFIIIDVSGSMNEMGKIYLQRNLCRYASQLQIMEPEKYSNFEIRFFQWAENISEIAIQSDGDIPALISEGRSDLIALSSFLSDRQNDGQILRVIVLSDGNFSDSDVSNFKKQLRTIPDLPLRTVAIGADVNLLKLKKISSNDSVYLPENISSAIDSTVFNTEKHPAVPEFTSQILQTKQVEPGEDWDV